MMTNPRIPCHDYISNNDDAVIFIHSNFSDYLMKIPRDKWPIYDPYTDTVIMLTEAELKARLVRKSQQKLEQFIGLSNRLS